MPPYVRTLALALFLCALSRAAIAQQEPVEFIPLADKPIKKIALLGVAPSRRFSVKNDSSAGVILAFGFLPALVEANEVDKKTRTYLDELKDRKVNLAGGFITALRRELGKSGYEFAYLREQRPRLLEDKKTLDFSQIKTDADAMLIVYYGHLGYLSPAFTTSYQPWVEIGVRLVDARTLTTLYYKNIFVYQAGKDAGSITAAIRNSKVTVEGIRPDPKFTYATFEDLMAKFDESVQGILQSQELVAQRIAQNLSPGGQPAPQAADPADGRNEPTAGAGQPFPAPAGDQPPAQR